MARGRKSKAKASPFGSQSQSTLSFNNKSARVTKPSARPEEAAAKKRLSSESAQTQLQEEVTEVQTPDPEKETGESAAEVVEVASEHEPEEESHLIRDTAEADVDVDADAETELQTPKPRARKRIQARPGKDERELEAEKVTDAQIKKYWRAEEESRLAPRVHQETLSLHEKILRHFDLSSQYGPCIGITRLDRWKRANMLELNPPVEVLAVLLREEDDKKSQGCGKLAYIDELAGGRVVLVE
ncbi:hypothetical protein HRR88_005912 [Exophiala dermatitidis]|nr:hypothetical protein HRR79_006568 [Exophiala dermatitidis]KAJ4621577.1 hypothetical protein HRR88_005912 [Exophiala dermatitidis]KAJ4637682.1 hypothetical protein HRR89_006176 [Exophiala dermatitidis]KAJ4649722.1 hypothetical protein HRR91_005783 [Exophiala dermatitidis]KAJ4672547.1 hypothetical protein HRR95_006364 [Exophiala dermatitidis]